MIGQDGYAFGLAFGKTLNDKEFAKEAETLRLRLKAAQEAGDIEHPLHVGMIETTNAVVQEIADVKSGKVPPKERRLSDPSTNIHRVEHFRKAIDDAEQRISGGKLRLDVTEPVLNIPATSMVSGVGVKIVPSVKRPKP